MAVISASSQFKRACLHEAFLLAVLPAYYGLLSFETLAVLSLPKWRNDRRFPAFLLLPSRFFPPFII